MYSVHNKFSLYLFYFSSLRMNVNCSTVEDRNNVLWEVVEVFLVSQIGPKIRVLQSYLGENCIIIMFQLFQMRLPSFLGHDLISTLLQLSPIKRRKFFSTDTLGHPDAYWKVARCTSIQQERNLLTHFGLKKTKHLFIKKCWIHQTNAFPV